MSINCVSSILFTPNTIGFLLLITHILACLTVGFLFRFWGNSYSGIYSKEHNTKTNFTSTKKISFSNLSEALSLSISNAAYTVMMIGGFVVIFSVVGVCLYTSNIKAVSKESKEVVFEVKENQKICRGKWNIPAGGVDDNENIIEAAKREIFEETGCSVKINGLLEIINQNFM